MENIQTITNILIAVLFMLLVAGMVYIIIKGSIGSKKETEKDKAKGREGKSAPWLNKLLKRGPEELVNAPVIYTRLPGQSDYTSYIMKKKKIKIGSDMNNDIILDDKTVEKHHASIEKVIDEDHVYYVFVNYAKLNPTEYEDLSHGRAGYEYMYYEDEQELGARSNFYVGQTKLIIEVPQGTHGHTDTEPVKLKQDSINKSKDEDKGDVKARVKSTRSEDDADDKRLSIDDTAPYRHFNF